MRHFKKVSGVQLIAVSRDTMYQIYLVEHPDFIEPIEIPATSCKVSHNQESITHIDEAYIEILNDLYEQRF